MNIEFNKTYYVQEKIEVKNIYKYYTEGPITINIGDAVQLVRKNVTDGEEILILRVHINRYFYLPRDRAEQILTDKKPINLSTMFDDEIVDLLKKCQQWDCRNCILKNNISECDSKLLEEVAKRLERKERN